MPSATKSRGAPGAALLDVNVLVALFDGDHVHHDLAHDWFSASRERGWATCPVTENGLIRVLANPKYGSALTSVPALAERLRAFKASGYHEFWPDSLSLTDASTFSLGALRGYRQLTDAYLLGLAHANGGRLATFDRAISSVVVTGVRPGTLEVVEAVDES